MEWRISLEWVPLLVFPLLLIIPLITGFFDGIKRSLYWGVGIFAFYCIGWILSACLASNLPDAFYVNILNMFKIDYSMLTIDEIRIIVAPIASIMFFFIAVLSGIIILLINYYTWAKKVLKIGKYSAKVSKSKLKRVSRKNVISGKIVCSHIFGSLILGTTILPVTTCTTEICFATTCRSNTAKLNNFCQSFNSTLSAKYISGTYTNMNSLLGIANLLSLKDNEGKNLMNALFDKIKDISNFQKSVKEMTITKENVDHLKNPLDNFSLFLDTKFTNTNKTYNEEISSYVNDIASSTYNTDVMIQILSKNMDSYNISLDRYRQIYKFLSLLQNKSGTNIYEDPSDIKLTNYWFKDWNWNKLSVNNNGFILFQKIIAKICFDDLFNEEQINSASSLLTNMFCENNNPVKTNEIIDIEPTVNYDDFIKNHLNFEEYDPSWKDKIDGCNGTEEHPYILPTELFWKLSGSTTIIKNDEYLKDDNEYGLIWSTYIKTNPEFVNDAINVKIEPLNTSDIKFIKVNVDDSEEYNTAYFTCSADTPTIDDWNTSTPWDFQLKFTCNNDISITKYFRIQSLHIL